MISADGRIILWDVRASNALECCFDYLRTDLKKSSNNRSNRNGLNQVAHTSGILGCSFIQGGSYLISVGSDKVIRLWNVLNGTNTLVNFGRTSTNANLYEATVQLASTDLSEKNFIFIPNGRSLSVYNAFDGELIATYKGHFDSLNCCLYNPVSNQVYTGSKDRNIITWSSKYGCMDEKKTMKKLNNFSGFS